MYRRIVLLGIAFLLIVQLSYSQIALGVKAGLLYNYGDFYFENKKDKLGYQFGIYSSTHISGKINFTTELLYSNKGKLSRFLQDNLQDNLQLNYLDLPLVLGYQLTDYLILQFGPELGYLLKKGYPVSAFGENVSYKRFELGVTAGVQITILDNLDLGFRYAHGLTSGMVLDERRQYKNRSFQISIGYRIK